MRGLTSTFSLSLIVFFSISCGDVKENNTNINENTLVSPIVFSPDRRRQVSGPDNHFRQGLGRVIARNINNPSEQFNCSAFSFWSVVITNAHCVYDRANKKIYDSIVFIPEPHPATAEGRRTYFYVARVWMNQKYARNSHSSIQIDNDIALLELEKRDYLNIPDREDFFSYLFTIDEFNLRSNDLISTAGYPRDKDVGTLWREDNCRVQTLYSNGFSHNCSVYGGQSGSPIFSDSSLSTVIAINTAKGTDMNFATPLTSDFISDIANLAQLGKPPERSRFYRHNMTRNHGRTRVQITNGCHNTIRVQVRFFDPYLLQWRQGPRQDTYSFTLKPGEELRSVYIPILEEKTKFYYRAWHDGNRSRHWSGNYRPGRGQFKESVDFGFHERIQTGNLNLTCNN